ncbi:MAG: 1-acyl-sn-glycerol-3-phosphate acyltransferase [Chlamydiia bacterium]|nr:1-acyl-sn-glycerol-3-phosphate acyltransferase [Chlamydiia bacterium]
MSCIYRFVLWFSWCFLRLFFRFRVYGQEHYYDGAGIIAANHASYLDPVVLSSAWPEEVHFLAKEPLFKIFGLGWFIRKLNSHPLKGTANDLGVIKQICGLLKTGKKVILFPEGQRSYDDKLLPIKPGVALLVSKSNSAIIPAYIFGTFEAWSRNRSFPSFGKKVGCVFGTPIKWAAFSHLDKREAQEALAKTLTDAIHALKTWYESGAKGSPP